MLKDKRIVAVFAFIAAGAALGSGVTSFLSLRKIHIERATLAKRHGSMNVAEVAAVFQKRLPLRDRPQSQVLAQHLIQLCKKFDFDPALILSLIHTESTFRPTAVSHVGAVGLMQVMPATAKFVADKNGIATYTDQNDLRNPLINITLGVTYLSYLRKRFRESPRFLGAYNMGPGRVGRMIYRKRFRLGRAVRKYVNDISNGVDGMRKTGRKLVSKRI